MNSFELNGRIISDKSEPFIIAEAGINHNGDIEIAKQMVLAAKRAGADAVKFQTFKAKDFIQDKTLMYTYKSQGVEITEPIIDMFERTEFSDKQWNEIKEFCDSEDMLFLSTPGNVSDMEMLMTIGVKALKIGSDDFVNIPLVRRYSKETVPLLLSCGMATEDEIDLTLTCAGYDEGKSLCLFLCTSQYPTPPEDVNINKIKTLKIKYPNLVIGLSDHTNGSVAAIMAVTCGATVFEKHFTLDHNLPGPDHWFSETPETLKEWIDNVRRAYIMLGKSDLNPTVTEMKNRTEYHRSITTSKKIFKGEVFSEENLCMRRPGDGLPGKMWDMVIGKISARDIEQNVQISEEDFKNE